MMDINDGQQYLNNYIIPILSYAQSHFWIKSTYYHTTL